MEVRIFDPFERLSLGILITILVFCGLYYWIKAKNNENKNEKHILIGMGGFFFGLASTRFFFFLCEMYLPGSYTGHIFYGNYEEGSFLYEFFSRLAYISSAIGGLLFFFMFERIIKKTRYLISILNIVGIFFIIILHFKFSRLLFTTCITPIHIVLVTIVLFYLTKWSRLEFKAVASMQVLAIAFIVIGTVLFMVEVKAFDFIPLAIPNFFVAMGAIISLSSGIINPKRYSKALNYWLILGSITLALGGVIIILFAITYEITYFISSIVIFVFILYSFLRTIQIIKAQSAVSSPSSIEASKGLDVFKGFTKRQNITENEVTYHKEQKICLVCKGKVTGFNLAFICPDCDVLYCEKCARVLSGMENACWVCNTAIDPSKPVQVEEIKIKETDSNVEFFGKAKK